MSHEVWQYPMIFTYVHITFPESENKKKPEMFLGSHFRMLRPKEAPWWKQKIWVWKKYWHFTFQKYSTLVFCIWKVKKNKNCHSKTCVRGVVSNIWYYQNPGPMDIFFSHLHLNPTVRCFVTWMFFYDDLQSFELATISTRSWWWPKVPTYIHKLNIYECV